MTERTKISNLELQSLIKQILQVSETRLVIIEIAMTKRTMRIRTIKLEYNVDIIAMVLFHVIEYIKIIIKFYLKSILLKHYNTSSNELFKLTTYKIHTYIHMKVREQCCLIAVFHFTVAVASSIMNLYPKMSVKRPLV